MNTPARIESLLWMAMPMAAWAQVGASTAPAGMQPVEIQKVATSPPAPKARRKRSKAPA